MRTHIYIFHVYLLFRRLSATLFSLLFWDNVFDVFVFCDIHFVQFDRLIIIQWRQIQSMTLASSMLQIQKYVYFIYFNFVKFIYIILFCVINLNKLISKFIFSSILKNLYLRYPKLIYSLNLNKLIYFLINKIDIHLL